MIDSNLGRTDERQWCQRRLQHSCSARSTSKRKEITVKSGHNDPDDRKEVMVEKRQIRLLG